MSTTTTAALLLLCPHCHSHPAEFACTPTYCGGLDMRFAADGDDSTPWCTGCGARTQKKCGCGPRAEND